jgi:NADH/NAD ratio-sensing transcriptional regulator Rex
MAWYYVLRSSIDLISELVSFLNKKAKNSSTQKRLVIHELRDNLNTMKNGYKHELSADAIVEALSNAAYRHALAENYDFNKIRRGELQDFEIKDKRNKRYLGWTMDRLLEKIDEKIHELKQLKKMSGGFGNLQHANISLMLSNLYFRMKLAAEFMQSE